MLFTVIMENFPSFFPFLEAPSYLQKFPGCQTPVIAFHTLVLTIPCNWT
jgi:hypothetical protein